LAPTNQAHGVSDSRPIRLVVGTGALGELRSGPTTTTIDDDAEDFTFSLVEPFVEVESRTDRRKLTIVRRVVNGTKKYQKVDERRDIEIGAPHAARFGRD